MCAKKREDRVDVSVARRQDAGARVAVPVEGTSGRGDKTAEWTKRRCASVYSPRVSEYR